MPGDLLAESEHAYEPVVSSHRGRLSSEVGVDGVAVRVKAHSGMRRDDDGAELIGIVTSGRQGSERFALLLEEIDRSRLRLFMLSDVCDLVAPLNGKPLVVSEGLKLLCATLKSVMFDVANPCFDRAF